MSKKFTRSFNAGNSGGTHVPFHERFGAWWRILITDAQGNLTIVEVYLPYDSCPRTWCEERKMVFERDALAERIC